MPRSSVVSQLPNTIFSGIYVIRSVFRAAISMEQKLVPARTERTKRFGRSSDASLKNRRHGRRVGLAFGTIGSVIVLLIRSWMTMLRSREEVLGASVSTYGELSGITMKLPCAILTQGM